MLTKYERLKFADNKDNKENSISQDEKQQLIGTKDPTYLLLSKLCKGNYQLCLELLESLPSEIFDNQPRLRIYKATAMVYCDFPVEDILQIMSEIEKSADVQENQGEILALKAKIEVNLGHISTGIPLSHKAYAKLDKDNIFFRKLIERNLGMAYTIKGDLRNAIVWFENLLLSSFKGGDFTDRLVSYHYLAHIHKIQGQLNIAGVIYKKALTFINQQNLENEPYSIKLISGYGHLLIQRNELDEAITFLSKAIQFAEETDPLYAHAAYHSLCEAFVRKGNFPKAFQVLTEFKNQINDHEKRYTKSHSAYASAREARINLEAGKIKQAYQWLLSRRFFPPSADILQKNSLYELGYSLPIAAKIYIAKGMYSQAIELLSPIIPKYVHQGANSYLIRALNTLAIAYFHSGDSLKAMIIINKTLRLAEPENNIGDFIFIGKQLSPILTENLRNSSSREFSQMLISLLSESAEYQHQNYTISEIQSALSRREMEVLHLLSKGLTNQEIADDLFLSANTIKSHTIKIYRKLNVNNRKRAVRKARLIGLLPEKNLPITHPSS